MSASSFRSVLSAVAGVLLATAAAAATPALADPTFTPATPIGTGEANAYRPTVAADASGDAVAVWSEDEGGDTEVVASTREADGPFSAPHVLSIPGDFAYTPTAVIDARGDATVVWGEALGAGGVDSVEVADHPAGGSWSAAQTVAPGNPGGLAADALGDELLTWTDGSLAASNLRVQYRHRGQPFALGTTPSAVETGTFGSTVLPALNATGAGVIAWTHDTVVSYPNIETHIEAARVSSDGAVGAPVPLTATHASAFGPALALSDAGVATVVYAAGDANSGPRSFHAVTLAADGTVGADQPLSATGAGIAEVAVDAGGDVTAAWDRNVAGAAVVEQATAPAAGAFSQPATVLDADATNSGPAVAAAPDGQALIAWGHSGTNTPGDPDAGTERAVFRAAGASAFGAPQTLGAGGDQPSAALACPDDAIDVFRTIPAQQPYPMSAATTIDPAHHGPSPCEPAAATTPATTTTATAAATPPAAAPPAAVAVPRRATPHVAALSIGRLVTLPPTRSCVSRRRFSIRLRVPKGSAVVSARVLVNGHSAAVRKGSRLRSTVNLRSLPKGRFTVKITLTLTGGRTLTETRRYRTCAPRATHRATAHHAAG
jgi:predicted thioesterase